MHAGAACMHVTVRKRALGKVFNLATPTGGLVRNTQDRDNPPASPAPEGTGEGKKDERYPPDVYADIYVCEQPTTGGVYAILEFGYEGVSIGAPIILGACDLRFQSTKDVERALNELGILPDMTVWVEQGSKHDGYCGKTLVDAVLAKTILHVPIGPPEHPVHLGPDGVTKGVRIVNITGNGECTYVCDNCIKDEDLVMGGSPIGTCDRCGRTFE